MYTVLLVFKKVIPIVQRVLLALLLHALLLAMPWVRIWLPGLGLVRLVHMRHPSEDMRRTASAVASPADNHHRPSWARTRRRCNPSAASSAACAGPAGSTAAAAASVPAGSTGSVVVVVRASCVRCSPWPAGPAATRGPSAPTSAPGHTLKSWPHAAGSPRPPCETRSNARPPRPGKKKPRDGLPAHGTHARRTRHDPAS